MTATLDISQVCYSFEFQVVVMVFNKRNRKIWHNHCMSMSGTKAPDIELVTEMLPRHLELRRYKKATPTRLQFAFWRNTEDNDYLPDELASQIPVPDAYINADE